MRKINIHTCEYESDRLCLQPTHNIITKMDLHKWLIWFSAVHRQQHDVTRIAHVRIDSPLVYYKPQQMVEFADSRITNNKMEKVTLTWFPLSVSEA